MIKIQLFLLPLLFIVPVFISFDSPTVNRHLRTAQVKQIDQTILDLYKSIELSEDHSPDWDLLRSLFMEGAHMIHVTEFDV